MIKRALFTGLILLLAIGLAGPAYCEDNAIKKLGRGICNVVTCPLEVTEQMKRTDNTDGAMAGVTYGVLKGVAMMGVRAVVGAYEILTFPIPLPKGYKPILKDPEFFFEDMNW